MRGRRLPARPRAAGRALSGVTGASRRRARSPSTSIRATFEEGAFTERAFRAGGRRARARGPRARPGAAPRLRRRAAARHQRRRDRAPRRTARRACSTRRSLAALRLGLYELLFADATPDHAAVDQAVELVKAAGAAHAAGFVNAVLRRAVRERDAADAALLGDDSTPSRAAVAHSAPLWLAEMWWDELGAEAARSLLAACNEPAEVALRVNTLARRPRRRARPAAAAECRRSRRGRARGRLAARRRRR